MPSCTKCQEDKPEDRYKMCQTCRDLMWERNKAWKAGIKRPRINNRPKAFDYMVEVFKAQAKKTHVPSKRKATFSSVKAWLQFINPSQFYANWPSDSPTYKDDSVEIWYMD